MRKAVLCLALVTAVCFAGSLAAATANFQGNCAAGVPTNCVYDALRPASNPSSCGSASISSTFWDFGDGSSLFTSGTFVSHVYTTGGCFDVDLAVFCSDFSSATFEGCMCNIIGVAGCVRPGAGWTP